MTTRKRPLPPSDDNSTVTARLTMVVEFEGTPDPNDAREIVKKARETGSIVRADLEILKATTIDLR